MQIVVLLYKDRISAQWKSTGSIKYCGIKNKQKKDFTEVKPLLMDLFDCMFCDPHGSQVKLL